ncbi:hypothetical protein NL108_008566 [Boleophthalmus pectinirostris]|nr:hypothetical protein NL108_008566 [Boleophthalmus pectinirostris]
MAASFRGRPIRSLRMRGRNDSGEENVPLDLTREPSENFREIVQNVAKPHGVSNMRKLGHLNNFIKIITVNAMLFPTSIANSLIAVGTDGLQERDRMVRAAIAIVCELALKNPEVVAKRARLSTILKSVIDCQLSRINEALITTILHLLNHPHTRQFVRVDVELEQILAPFTDFHYRHNADTAEGQLKDYQPMQGWEFWYPIFNWLTLHTKYGDPARFQDTWRLSDGFVAAEAKVILPHRARSRPDLMDNYLAFVLSAFITNGLLEGIVEVVTSSDDQLAVRATILLGELLHMANTILPHSHSHHLHCLPTLINMAASFDISQEKRLRASAAVNNLKRFHEKKKKGLKPYSLYLDHIIRKSVSSQNRRESHSRPQRDIYVIKDTEEALMMNLRDSQILNHKQNLEWNWLLIATILKVCPISKIPKFVRRLLYFYKPSSKLYAGLALDHMKARQLTVVGCQFIEFLMDSDEDGQGYLEDLVRDMVLWLSSSSGLKPERSLQSNGLLTTLSQHYFLFLGTLSAHLQGVKLLEKCGLFQWLVLR